MAPSESELIFDVADLETLSVDCPKCGTTILYRATIDPNFGVAGGCPTCMTDFTPDVLRALKLYRQFFETVKLSATTRIRLRAKSTNVP